jgi:hypothetical protein
MGAPEVAIPDVSEKPKLPLEVDSPIVWAEELIDADVLKEYYAKHNIRCFLCDAALAETFAEGAKVHEGGPYGGFNAEKVVQDLNALAKDHPFDPAKAPKSGILKTLVDWMFSGPKQKA